MKRKSDDENSENKKREKQQSEEDRGVGGDHPAWDIIIKKLDFQSQMKLSHQSHRLGKFPNSFSTAVRSILEAKLRYFFSHVTQIFENSPKRKL